MLDKATRKHKGSVFLCSHSALVSGHQWSDITAASWADQAGGWVSSCLMDHPEVLTLQAKMYFCLFVLRWRITILSSFGPALDLYIRQHSIQILTWEERSNPRPQGVQRTCVKWEQHLWLYESDSVDSAASNRSTDKILRIFVANFMGIVKTSGPLTFRWKVT